MAQQAKIDSQRWYTLQEIAEKKMFPWLQNSYWSVRRVALNSKYKKLLKPVTMGEGRNIRYQFKGANISKFIQAVETGAVRL